MSDHETAMICSDIVLFSKKRDEWHVLLIRRAHPPFEDYWALPGGHVDGGETFRNAASRELAEETGVASLESLSMVGVYDDPGRDPRGRVVSVTFAAVVDDTVDAVAGSDAREARWVPLDQVGGDGRRLAFDHEMIVKDAASLLQLSHSWDDRLSYIKSNYTDQGMGCLMSEDDILWLVEEVTRLRATLKTNADIVSTYNTPNGAAANVQEKQQ